MPRVTRSVLIVCFLLAAGSAFAQENATAATATCNFDENSQLVVEYQRVSFNLKKPLSLQLTFGKVWAPGGKPMTLFTNTPIRIAARNLPAGAYTLFVIPAARHWTLVVSKSTETSGAYNEQQDVVRVPLDSGELPSPEPEFSVSFAHAAPDQCNIRLDLDKDGHFTAIQQNRSGTAANNP
ncbi:MAG TPA: DUF2911 domain-containing protein [Candidatus Binatia bacterium]|nr:DUF2911 domain-containing protein [Candidatus Binatia bacterium]